jgi:hypothetical protein
MYIPKIFVVDGRGNIAWTGAPTELAHHLEEVVAGRHDYEVPIREQLANDLRRRSYLIAVKQSARERSASTFNEVYVNGLLEEKRHEEAFDALGMAAHTYEDLPHFRSVFRRRQLCIIGLTSHLPEEALELAMEVCSEFLQDHPHSTKDICNTLITYHSITPPDNRDERIIELVFAMLEFDPPGEGTIDAIRDRVIRARALVAKRDRQEGIAEFDAAIADLEKLIKRLGDPDTPGKETRVRETLEAQQYLDVLGRLRAKLSE